MRVLDGGLGQAQLVGSDIGKGRFARWLRNSCVELAAGDFGRGDREILEAT